MLTPHPHSNSAATPPRARTPKVESEGEALLSVADILVGKGRRSACRACLRYHSTELQQRGRPKREKEDEREREKDRERERKTDCRQLEKKEEGGILKKKEKNER